MSVVTALAAIVWSVAPCTGSDASPWLAAFHERVLSYDGLAAFAVAEFGEPLACEGEVTAELDGADYGVMVLTFFSGVTLTVETQPLETSITTLRSAAGFPDPARVEAALRAYTLGIGVSVDWERAERRADDGEEVISFRDPDAGLNASAELRRSGDRLVAVRFSMAL